MENTLDVTISLGVMSGPCKDAVPLLVNYR